jgi:hypothetical protein
VSYAASSSTQLSFKSSAKGRWVQTRPFAFSSQLKKGKDQVTRKQDSAKGRIKAEDVKRLLAEDRDLLKVIVEETLQQVLEAEMDEALRAGKGERAPAMFSLHMCPQRWK